MIQRLDELDLYRLDWGTPEFAADPYSRFEAARAKHPWLAKTDAGYAVFDLQAIRELMVRDDQLRPSFDGIVEFMGAQGTAWGRFAEEQMIALPDREHMLLRDALARKFTPRYATNLRPLMREVMTRLLSAWTPRERIDFEEFASYYPVAVTTQMIGAPQEAIPALRSAMETLGLAFAMNPATLPALDRAMEEMERFVDDLIAKRRADTTEGRERDLLDLLIEAGAEGGINERQLVDLLIFLFVAGYDTSKNVLTYMMRLMISHPDIYHRCAEDHDYCGKVVEETLRMFNPSSAFRSATEDIVYRDVLIPKGTMLFFTLNVSGRVSKDIENPHAFDPDRIVAPHLRQVGFGMGKHMCLGQYIARAQLQEGIHLVAQHMRDPEQTAEPGWRPFPGVWGIKGLPIAFAAR